MIVSGPWAYCTNAQRGDDAGVSSRREVDETAETLLWLIVDGQRSLVQGE
jgi:hypothetical protein